MTRLVNTGKTGAQIRQEFLDFFSDKAHSIVPSASLMPYNDPTLLFTNAGMNQFKDVFLGAGSRDYTRAADTQKCIRAGGKHNDLEDVGRDTYHHTFFEMLGNWSFGDYFKAEAITWAWELLTKVWGLPRERLYATVFAGDEADGLAADDEAAELWRNCTDIDPSHILRFGRKDNFWEMGETGPCGPCTEIHIDRTPDMSGGDLVNADDARVIELWNLVFIQFNRGADGKLTTLPARHVDTGMGFERICSVLQGVESNYDTDVFTDIFKAIAEVTGAPAYTGKMDDMRDTAYRVIADHIRALTFAITDGILPSNEGRGYVLRRILRRAARYGRQQLGVDSGGFLHKLAPAVVELMGGAFPELTKDPSRVAGIIAEEEESFNRTLDRGIALFEAEADKLEKAGKGKTLSGEIAFELYATYGFPPDLTALMARERGLEMDQDGYDAAMEAHKLTSAGGEGKFKVVHIAGLPAVDDSAKYDPFTPLSAKVLGWAEGDKFFDEGMLEPGDKIVSLVTGRTNFYGESGGQVGDGGVIACGPARFDVSDTQVSGDCVLHVGTLGGGPISVGDEVTMTVDSARLDTMRNHTATHLLNWALRRVLGDHVDQKGSEVGPDRLRFDFANPKAVTAEQIVEIERLVNAFILADRPVGVNVIALDEAMNLPGVRAVFGEKYPDPVRVVSAGAADPRVSADEDCSVEFCGGSHLDRTGIIGLFKIVGEESISKGVRRITAVTGRGAVETVAAMSAALGEITASLKAPPEQAAERIAAMQQEIKTLKKKLASGGGASVSADALVASAVAVGDARLLVASCEDAAAQQLRGLVDQLRQKLGDRSAIFLGSTDEGKVALVAAVSDALIAEAGLKAGDWVKQIAPIVGGGGGGRPQSASAGGKQPEKLPEAIEAARRWAAEKLG